MGKIAILAVNVDINGPINAWTNVELFTMPVYTAIPVYGVFMTNDGRVFYVQILPGNDGNKAVLRTLGQSVSDTTLSIRGTVCFYIA